MGAGNVDIVRRGFAALNSGDVDAVIAQMDPSVVWFPTPDFLDVGPFRGHDGVRDLINLIVGAFDEYVLEPEELIDGGDTVVVPVHQTGRGKGSGLAVDARYILVFTMRDGRTTRVDSYYDRGEALAAAGLARRP
jgi:ketosteroid isomerase-like protein